jgi:serine/threonine protein kinase
MLQCLPTSAPEVLASGRVSPKSDVYSFGFILYQLASGRTLRECFAARDWTFVEADVMERDSPTRHPPLARYVTDVRLQRLIACCWRYDASQRPTMDQISWGLSELLRLEDYADVQHQ